MKLSKNIKVVAISCCVGCPFVSYEQDEWDIETWHECCGWYDRRLIDSEGYPYEYYEKPEWCKVTEVGARVGKS